LSEFKEKWKLRFFYDPKKDDKTFDPFEKVTFPSHPMTDNLNGMIFDIPDVTFLLKKLLYRNLKEQSSTSEKCLI
jgi:hypothetical protein